jgi:CubicO group peptidase (beta-lactamase class C family)
MQAGAMVLAMSVAAAAQAAVLPAPLGQLDATVEQVRARFQVPGIAVAVVKDGQVVFSQGWGVRQAGTEDAVDGDTLFAIASNTKAMTATALSMLAEQGMLSLDDRVIDHLPWFRMGDAYLTREMRLRDLLVHRSGLGLGAGDLLYWPNTDYTTTEVVQRLAQVPVSGGFRERYAYDNVLYAVAQLVIEQVSGQAFDAFLQQRIFNPAGMHHTRFNADHLTPRDKVAIGHALQDWTTLQTVPAMTWHNNSGAGGVYSTATDMARWMNVQLDGGRLPGGKGRLFSDKRQQQMWSIITPQAIAEPVVPELAPMLPNFAGYGEGWSLSDYRGQKLVWHTGGWPGMVSRVTLVPGLKLGVVVLTNQEVGAAFNVITYSVLDAYLSAPPTDWVDAYARSVAKAREKADAQWAAHQAARAADSSPSLPLAAYVGTYRDRWYGDVRIEQAGDRLRLRFSRTAQLVGTLEHWQHDTFIVRWDDRALNADAFVTFTLDVDGKVRSAGMQSISSLTDFRFDFQALDLRAVAP